MPASPLKRVPSPAQAGRYALLLLCTTIGCYLPATFRPFGTAPVETIPFTPPTEVVPPLISPGPEYQSRPGSPEIIGPLTLSWPPSVPLRDWEYIVLHHTATDSGSVDSIDLTHRERTDANGTPWRGIGYHFVIGNGDGMRDGEIRPTFRWLDQSAGAHAGNLEYNTLGIGICLVGNFEEHAPTAAQLSAVKRLVAQLKAACEIDSAAVLRHGDVKATDCPGRLFPHDEIAVATISSTGAAGR